MGFSPPLGLGKFQNASKRLKRFINLESFEIEKRSKPIRNIGGDIISELKKSPSESFGRDLSPLSKGQARSIREPYMDVVNPRTMVATPFAPPIAEALYGEESPQARAPLYMLPLTPTIPESVIRKSGVGNIPYVGDEVAAMGAGLTTPLSVGTMGLGLGAAAPGTMAARLPLASRFLAQGPRSMAGEIAGATALGAASRPIEEQTGTIDTPVGGIGPHVLSQVVGGGVGAGLAGRTMIPDVDAPFIKKRAIPGSFETGESGLRYPQGTEIRGKSGQVYQAGDIKVHIQTKPNTKEFVIDLTEGKGSPMDAARVWNYVYDLANLNEDWKISAQIGNENLYSHLDRLGLPRHQDPSGPSQDFLFNKQDMDDAVDRFKAGNLPQRDRKPAYNIAARKYLDEIPGSDGITPIGRSSALMSIERYLAGSTAIDKAGLKERILHMLGPEYERFRDMPEFDDIFNRMEEARIRNAGRQGSLPAGRRPDITDDDVAAGIGQVGQGQQNLLDSITDVDNSTVVPDARNIDLTPEQQTQVDNQAFGQRGQYQLNPRRMGGADIAIEETLTHLDDDQIIYRALHDKYMGGTSGEATAEAARRGLEVPDLDVPTNPLRRSDEEVLAMDDAALRQYYDELRVSTDQNAPPLNVSSKDPVDWASRDIYYKAERDYQQSVVELMERRKTATTPRELIPDTSPGEPTRFGGGKSIDEMSNQELNNYMEQLKRVTRGASMADNPQEAAIMQNYLDELDMAGNVWKARMEEMKKVPGPDELSGPNRAADPIVERERQGLRSLSDDEVLAQEQRLRERIRSGDSVAKGPLGITRLRAIMMEIRDRKLYAKRVADENTNISPPDSTNEFRMAADDMGNVTSNQGGDIQPDDLDAIPPPEAPTATEKINIVKAAKGGKGRNAVYRVVEEGPDMTSADRVAGRSNSFTRAIITGRPKGGNNRGSYWTVNEIDGAGNPIDSTGRTFNSLNEAKEYAFDHYSGPAAAAPGSTPSGAGLSGAQQKLLKELGYSNDDIDMLQSGMGGPPIDRPPTKLGGPDEPLPDRGGEQLQMISQREDVTRKGPMARAFPTTAAEIREEVANIRSQMGTREKGGTWVNKETGEIVDVDEYLSKVEKNAIKAMNERGKKNIRNPEGLFRAMTGPNARRAKNFVLNTLNLPKGALTNFVELSVMFAQNFLQTVSHPFMTAENMKKFWKSVVSDEGYRQINDKIISRADDIARENPNAAGGIKKLKNGLIINPENAPINDLEDVMGSNFWFRAPGIRRWSRATQTFLNAQRIDKFEKLLDMVPADQMNNPKYFEDLASYTLAATGRGTIPQVIANNAALVRLIFAPRLWAGHFQFLASPALYNNSVIRKDFARTAAAVAAFGTTSMALMELMGADINTDPRSVDWGKGKFGNQRVDFWGGYQQDARFLYNVGQAAEKFAKGEKPTVTALPESGIPYEQGIDDYIQQYVRTKLDPVGEGVATALTGRTVTGKAMPNMENLMYNSFTPLLLQDIVESYKNEGLVGAARAAPLSYMGVRVNTYKPNKFAEAIQVYEKETGKDYNPETDFVKLQTMPSTQPLMEASLKERADANQQFAKEIIQQDKNFELKEQELRLPEMAQAILDGNELMGARFAETYQDYQDHITAVLGHKTIANEETKESPAGKALQKFLDINKMNDKYWNPVTGDVDIELYIEDKNKAFEDVRKIDPALVTAIESRMKTHDEATQKVEQEYKKADKLYREYLNMPKWDETVKNQDSIKDIQRLASRLGYMMAEQGMANVPPLRLYNMLKEANPDIDEGIFKEAFKLRSGTKLGSFKINDARTQFLIKNKALLYKYFPDIYNKGTLADAAKLSGLSRAGAALPSSIPAISGNRAAIPTEQFFRVGTPR